jgi:pyroglutamyl-peptidase
MHVAAKPPKETPNYDMILNIGMAPGRKFFTLETCAHRDGYNKKDVEGKTLERDTLWKEVYKSPEILHTSFDTEDVWRRWKSGLVGEDVRPSNNAGHYLCDFTYYACMLEYWRRDPDGQRPCIFLHVPGGWSAEDVLRGKEVALGLIAACVGSEKARGKDTKEPRSEDTIADDFGDEGLS